MESTRTVLTESEIANEINRLKRKGRNDEIIELVSSDYSFGLTKEEVNIYLSKQLEVAQMRMVSKAIREHGVDFAKLIAKEKYDSQRMQVAIQYCDKGVPMEAIEKGLEQTTNAHSLKEVFQKVLIAVNVDKEKEQMKQQLEEKDTVIQNQKKTIEEAHSEIARLKRENEELQAAKTEVKEVPETTETQPESVEVTSEIKVEPEVQYVVGVTGQNQSVIALPIERAIPSKQKGMYAFAGKLAFKKKSRQDIVGMVASGRLNTAQLVQIKHAIERGLTEQQLVHLINSCVPPEQMKEIIEIAELENTLT